MYNTVDPCAAAASRRAEILCHAPRRRRIFCGSAKFQPKMEILSASRIFFEAVSALTEIESIISFQSPNNVEYGVIRRHVLTCPSYANWQNYILEWHLLAFLLNACSRPLH